MEKFHILVFISKFIYLFLKVNFEEFMTYLDILLNGNVDEKNEWTFKLIDVQKKGWFNLEDLTSLIVSFVNIWLLLSANQMSFIFFINR